MSLKHVDPNLAVHPLRHTLSEVDWERIQKAMEDENVNNITDEELDAVNDILYDAIVAKLQTHEGVRTLQ